MWCVFFFLLGSDGVCIGGGGGVESGVGCRTLVSLHKLGRRLGLTRFFRTLRIQNADGSGETCTRRYLNHQTTTSERGGMYYSGDSSHADAGEATLGTLRRFQSVPNPPKSLSLNLEETGRNSLHQGETSSAPVVIK
jgi:hypothetical protein